MIGMLEAMGAELEALHSAQREQARALCHSCGVLSMSELQPPAPSSVKWPCAEDGCNYPEGECAGACEFKAEGVKHGA